MALTLQTAFGAALLDPDRAVPEGVTGRPGGRPDVAFGVYRNNVLVGLTEAVRAGFPAVERIVGAEFFAAMARLFVARHPPRSPVLLDYGADFPEFVEGFAPAASLPYLADVARLEAARTRAYHAADAEPLAIAELQTVPAESLGDLRFAFHPSAHLLRSPHPVFTIWAMNAGDLPLGPVDDHGPEEVAVSRPALAVEIRRLPPGGAAFLDRLMAGATLSAAAEAAATEADAFDLSANLAGLFSAGLVTGFDGATKE